MPPVRSDKYDELCQLLQALEAIAAAVSGEEGRPLDATLSEAGGRTGFDFLGKALLAEADAALAAAYPGAILHQNLVYLYR